jgi:chromosome segregation ATPase
MKTWRDRKIEKLEAEIASLREKLDKAIERGLDYERENGRLRFENSTHATRIHDLNAKIAELESRLYNER